MILVARRLRGLTAWTDAFFPLLLLNWGHCENLIWCWQVEFVLSTLLAGVALLIIACSKEGLTRRSLIGMTCCLILLPLTGANGFVLTPLLILWLAYAIVRGWRGGPLSNRAGHILALAALVAAVIPAAAYLLQYERGPDAIPRGSVRDTCAVSENV